MSRPSPDVVGRRLQDRFVLVNLSTNRIYELNSTAALLWELLEAGTPVSELEPALLERVEVDPGELRDEIDSTLRVMTEAGLVTAA
jgi:hypothetical protein